MKKTMLIAWACAATVQLSAQNSADAPLEAAKSLYLSASYQEALTTLDAVQSDAQVDEVAKYRALCLLGLNRQQDAEDTVVKLITRHPLFALDPLDSPKLRAMFTDARARVLPAAATNMYSSAKAAFDRGELSAAAEQFQTVVTLVSQPEVTANPAVADLKVLANGFASLAEQELASQKKAAAAAATPAPQVAKTSAPAVDRIYSEQDADVVPPVPLLQEVPQWNPPNTAVRSVTFVGSLDIIIDEQGNVTGAAITRSTLAPYDQQLLAATKRWKYRPASFAGHTVKYRKTVRVTLLPQAPGRIPPPPAGS